ncbi:ABC transporter substrate-binding protein [Streptomyces sp. M19]
MVYKLNPRAVWSDGRPLGAADFVAQWRSCAAPTARTGPPATRVRPDLQVERGAGPHEVEVTFAKPYADWRSLFTPLYPRTVTDSPDAFNEGRAPDCPPAPGRS